MTADRIITVSQGYAWEITTVEGGWGLDTLLRSRQFVLSGIVNGVVSSTHIGRSVGRTPLILASKSLSSGLTMALSTRIQPSGTPKPTSILQKTTAQMILVAKRLVN